MTRSESLSGLFGRVYEWVTAGVGDAEGWRVELERQLSLAMADETSRGVYQYALQRLLNRRVDSTRIPLVWPHHIPLARVLAAGWAGVDDRTLACLGLNLFNIEGLAEAYRNAEADGGLGDRWREVLGTLTPEERAETPANLLLDYHRKALHAVIFQSGRETDGDEIATAEPEIRRGLEQADESAESDMMTTTRRENTHRRTQTRLWTFASVALAASVLAAVAVPLYLKNSGARQEPEVALAHRIEPVPAVMGVEANADGDWRQIRVSASADGYVAVICLHPTGRQHLRPRVPFQAKVSGGQGPAEIVFTHDATKLLVVFADQEFGQRLVARYEGDTANRYDAGQAEQLRLDVLGFLKSERLRGVTAEIVDVPQP